MTAIRVRITYRSLAAALAVALGGCYAHYDHSYPAPVPPPFDTWENEPNDVAWSPDPIGPLAVGDGLIIGGHVTELGPDFFDGFAFQSVEPCDIQFTLVAENPGGDLDLCVYDPQLGVYSFCFENGGSVETGRFSVPNAWTDFHLVVSSFSGDSEYRLDVACLPITFGALAQSAPASTRLGRAVPMERYFAAENEPAVEPTTQVVARGVALELDLATDELRTAPVVVLAGRK
jgi:hypothetical protein